MGEPEKCSTQEGSPSRLVEDKEKSFITFTLKNIPICLEPIFFKNKWHLLLALDEDLEKRHDTVGEVLILGRGFELVSDLKEYINMLWA